jgi:tetratricopeptide (TPR) repeat protein
MGGGSSALVGGSLALKAEAIEEAIVAFEALLNGPTVADPPVAGAVVLAFSLGMISFDINSLAGVAMLIFAYARAGRADDALRLAGQAYRVTGAEGFLDIQLGLLGDAKRWQDLLDAAEARNPDDIGRYEIEMRRGEALEELRERAAALQIYADIASLHADLTWIHEAQTRRDRLMAFGDSLSALPEPSGHQSELDAKVAAVEEAEDASFQTGDGKRHLDEDAFVYDPFGLPDLPTDRHAAKLPTGEPPPPRFSMRIFVSLGLFLASTLSGEVSVSCTPQDQSYPGQPAATWLALLDTEPVDAVLDRLDAAIAAEPPGGSGYQPDPAELAAKLWQRVLAAMLAAAAERSDASDRLASVLLGEDTRELVDTLSGWFPGSVVSLIGDLYVYACGCTECLLLPLAARLRTAGELDAARAWIEWGRQGADSPSLRCAAVALAFDAGDDGYVLDHTDGMIESDTQALVLMTYRGRSLIRLGRLDSGVVVLEHALSIARKLPDESTDVVIGTRYLLARALLSAGDRGRALRELHTIEAAIHNYLDVQSLLEVASAPVAGRQVIPRDVMRSVFERDEGRCIQCGAQFELQFDHVIPVAMGGGSTADNLQLLCGECNRRKGATLG